MNTAFPDSLNLAWKIHHVETGFANRSVLSTYESERKLVAEALLDFDASYATLFSQRVASASEMGAAFQNVEQDEDNDFVKTFKQGQEFTSGYGILYPANEYIWSPIGPATSPLFLGKRCQLRPGYVMPSANVTRVVDGNPVHLEQEIPLSGSFRVFVYADVWTLLNGLSSTWRPISRSGAAFMPLTNGATYPPCLMVNVITHTRSSSQFALYSLLHEATLAHRRWYRRSWRDIATTSMLTMLGMVVSQRLQG